MIESKKYGRWTYLMLKSPRADVRVELHEFQREAIV